MIADFWWNSSSVSKGLHWTKWENLCKPKCAGGLGFRSLVAFNQALLAKQSWRITHFPELLMSKVLKCRYFQKNSFLECRLGSNPSLVWRSILWGKSVFEAGARWRIGDGKHVSIYKSNWMPRPMLFRPFSPLSLPENAVVSDLMLNGNSWNEPLIYSRFFKEDVEMICSIPLPSNPNSDALIWHFDKRGMYTIKSGYQVAIKTSQNWSSADPSHNDDNWNQLWNLAIPPKVKIFLWKITKNFLPSSLNLFHRRIKNSLGCGRCGHAIEDDFHALFQCPLSAKVWQLSSSLFQQFLPWSEGLGGVASLIWRIVEDWKGKQVVLFALLLWNLWGARNLHVFQNKVEEPRAIVSKAINTLVSMDHVDGGTVSGGPQSPILSFRWIPPTFPWLKINVDAAVNSQKCVASIGCIIRNHKGSDVAAMAKRILFVEDVEAAEAKAILEGILLGVSLHVENMIVESDALNVVDLCLEKYDTEKKIVWIISDIKNLVRRYVNVLVRYASRSRNSKAHQFAKLGLESVEPLFWIDEILNFPDQFL